MKRAPDVSPLHAGREVGSNPTTIPLSTVSRKRLSEEVADRLEETILDGELRLGDKLPPEPALAKRFGVSRTAIREAVKALAEKGLVRVQQGQGSFVTRPSAQHATELLNLYLRLTESAVFELLEVRHAVEVEVAALAAARRTDEELHAIEAALRQMLATMEVDDVAAEEAFIEADITFHLAIAQATHNHIFVFILTTLRELMRENIRQGSQGPDGRRQAAAQHERILAALMAGDAGRARDAMVAHLDEVRKRITRSSLGPVPS